MRRLQLSLALIAAGPAIVSGIPEHARAAGEAASETIRLMTFNIEDVGTEDLRSPDERLRRVAEVIQRIEPDILLVNEIAWDVDEGESLNGSRLAGLLMKPQARGLPSMRMVAFSAPVNTGVHSGHDLDNDGAVTSEPGSRAYGGDCLGYGEYPGQYGMALLVSADMEILTESIRTFRDFRWMDMPGALLPPMPEDESTGWYSAKELEVLPLSSKSHWDVPVRLPDGRVLHVLCSHPTPPVFDGPEDRNGRRNHDEIRFWAEYLDDAPWIVDDKGVAGGLDADASFVIMGDLNADPEAGDSRGDPVGSLLLAHRRVQAGPAPASAIAVEGLPDHATSRFRLRVDYVLPSRGLDVVRATVWRGLADGPEVSEAAAAPFEPFPTDHFPVWLDISPENDPPKDAPPPE